MNNSVFTLRRRGFTLIELLIVIVVIAILALIVIPRVMGASRKAKESSLKGNLQELRNGLEQFQADTGAYPNQLTDLIDLSTAAPTTGIDGLPDGASVAIPSGSYKGPYLTPQGGLEASGIPINPFAPTLTAATLSLTDLQANWTYSNGIVQVPANTPAGSTLDGIPYKQL
jgi:type II secretion system protein G